MTNIHRIQIDITERQYETSESDPDDKYDRANTDTDRSIHGFKVVNEDTYSDFPVDFLPEYGIPYLLLYAVWSTGDSFGHDSRSHIEYYGLFRADQAEFVTRLKAFLEAQKRELDDEYDEMREFEGKKYCFPWNGYFDSLSEVEIETVFRR